MIMKLLEKYLEYAKGLTEKGGRFKNKKELADFVGITPSQVTKYQSAENMQNIGKFLDFLEKVGGGLTFGNWNSVEASREVCFVNARVMPAGQHIAPPVSEDYIAAPLVGEVGAGPGYFAQDDVESWFLVYKNLPSIMGRRNLIAVEIGRNSTSMSPLLNPKDIVLVDRDDINVDHPGHIMLVRDPEGAGMIKRVAMHKEGADWYIQFYSDNAAQNPPLTYKLREYYDGEICKAVVGRVIWAWADVREK